MIKAINNYYTENNVSRSRLGLSQIGHPCLRFVWYCYKQTPKKKFNGRKLRLFDLGNLIEKSLIDDFIKIGYKIHSLQKKIKIDSNDITLFGAIDGIIEIDNQSFLLEIKSANDASFNDLKRNQSYNKWNVVYKAQIHAAMLIERLNQTIVLVYNKNTSDLYYEEVTFNKEYITLLKEKIFKVITTNIPPEEKTCLDENTYSSKSCDFYKICFKS